MSDKVNHILKPISPDYVGAYLNTGIQLYDLIEWTLRQTGKASVTVMTFSLSEEFIRKIFLLKKAGLIERITVLLDFKAIQKTQKLVRFAGNVFDDIVYAKTHAKIVLIDSATHKVAISGSQNATRGNREESGIVTTIADTYLQFETEIKRIKEISIRNGV